MELKLFKSDNNLFILLSILILNKYLEVKTISTEKLIGCVHVQYYIHYTARMHQKLDKGIFIQWYSYN